MSLLARVVSILDEHGIPHGLIGAGALAVHGLSRATVDVDLLTTEARVLSPEPWSRLVAEGVKIDIRRGDADDPLAGVARLALAGERTVDLLVGRAGWQRDVVERAESTQFLDVRLRVARAADLILLKLFAGGPQDAWDVSQLLEGDDPAALRDEVEARLGALPEECQHLWARITAG